MIHKKYSCNICEQERSINALFGMSLSVTKLLLIVRGNDRNESKKHICFSCVMKIREFTEDIPDIDLKGVDNLHRIEERIEKGE